ncbi:MAG: glycogen/starch synthase, partial [bacterium]|nr:glycogen/starch synthase [bacterium]
PLKTVFTIHNLGNQGKWNAKAVENWLFDGKIARLKRFGENFNFMAEGIMNADIVTTVSPSYAKEIRTPEYGMGLEKIINSLKRKPAGILNGIDCEFFNPETDKFIFSNYSQKKMALKRENKLALQKFCGLAVDGEKPVFGLVSRLTGQKGIALIAPVIKELVSRVQFVFLGAGEKKYEEALIQAGKKFPQNVFVQIGFSEELAHRIYAGSDFFLMPSIFEPCGLGQMIAMRYGAIPVCRRTGGLKDTVKDGKNGFLFEKPSPAGLKKAVLRALDLFFDKPRFQIMRNNCLKENFCWENRAREYRKMYSGLLTPLET